MSVNTRVIRVGQPAQQDLKAPKKPFGKEIPPLLLMFVKYFTRLVRMAYDFGRKLVSALSKDSKDGEYVFVSDSSEERRRHGNSLPKIFDSEGIESGLEHLSENATSGVSIPEGEVKVTRVAVVSGTRMRPILDMEDDDVKNMGICFGLDETKPVSHPGDDVLSASIEMALSASKKEGRASKGEISFSKKGALGTILTNVMLSALSLWHTLSSSSEEHWLTAQKDEKDEDKKESRTDKKALRVGELLTPEQQQKQSKNTSNFVAKMAEHQARKYAGR